MTRTTARLSISLDGYAGGMLDDPDDIQAGLQDPYFARATRWIVDAMTWRERQGFKGGSEGVNNDVIDEEFSTTGAYVMGRRMADAGLVGWGDVPPFGCPVFVVTHQPRDSFDKGGTRFTFVNSVEEAVSRARDAAGGKDAAVVGGVSVVRHAIMAGLVEELNLHVVPVIVGQGVRLFEPSDHLMHGQGLELTPTRVLSQDDVTHLRYEVAAPASLRSSDDIRRQ